MKKLFLVLLAVSALQLTGCAKPMMVKENNNKVVNFFLVKVTNDKKITDKEVNLSFLVDSNVNLREFDYSGFKEDVINGLKSKGVNLSPNGKKYVIKIDYMNVYGNNLGKQSSYGTGIVDGVADATGLGLAARVAGGFAENAVTNSIRDNTDKTCDSSSCAVGIGVSISGKDYKTSFSLRDSRVNMGYYARTENFSQKAVVEFFEPK